MPVSIVVRVLLTRLATTPGSPKQSAQTTEPSKRTGGPPVPEPQRLRAPGMTRQQPVNATMKGPHLKREFLKTGGPFLGSLYEGSWYSEGISGAP